MESTFTPGPWMIDHQRIMGDGECVALVGSVDPDLNPGQPVDWPKDEAEFDEYDRIAEANARLIAASPRMASSLQRCIAAMRLVAEDTGDDFGGAIDDALATLEEVASRTSNR